MTPEQYEQIGRLYHAALGREPAERAAFLAEACAGDEALGSEVASLLAAHEQAGSFIDLPPGDAAAGWEAAAGSICGRSLGHYQLLTPLGRGGMGEVWLAQDTRLGRRVALKLLPAELTSHDERVRRFEREARAASALNHPNILTIHEVGRADGAYFIVTEFVEGETLRQRMGGGRMQLREALDVAIQVAAALDAAHQAGIVHRDIKPENVILRPDGLVKVLDFGLAKLIETPAPAGLTQASTMAGASTEPGVVMGTPRYMSPEQARGERVDGRTDIFSLGAVAYEMVAGRAPFAGVTPNEVIAAIFRDEPPPLADHAPEAPRELEGIVSRALRKDRERRYQTAKEMLDDLKDFKLRLTLGDFGLRGAEAGSRGRKTECSDPKQRASPFSIRLLAALAVLAIAAAAVWSSFYRRPALTSKDTILLADFENKTGDAIFDGTLKQGLAIQLQQSPFLNLLPDERVRETLRLMERSADERVTVELARDICLRENLKALIAGAIAPFGSHYVITLEAINGQSGETLAREQVEAESREQVLRALSQAATRLREDLGESLNSIQQFDRVIEDATTDKLEAFKAHAMGVEISLRGQFIEAIPLFRRAVGLDPNFAYAWSLLSAMHWSTGRSALAAEYAEKAYALRDRASEFEKFRIDFRHHIYVTGDVDKGIEVMMLQKRIFPRGWSGPNDLAIAYNLIGQSDQALAEAREAIPLHPYFAIPYRELSRALLRLNRFAEAKDALAQALQQKLEMTEFHTSLYHIAFASGDTSGMRQQIEWALGKPEEYVAFDWQAGAAAFAGQRHKARELSRRAIDLAARGDMKEAAARCGAEQALRSAVFGDCFQARVDGAQGLKLARGRASLPRVALARALCGEADQAKSLIDEVAKRFPEDTIVNSVWLPAIRAVLELQRGNAAQAIEQLQTASRYEAAAELWPQYLRGLSHLKLGRAAAAAAEFQKVLDHQGQAPLSVLYPLARLGLARAAAMNKDAVKSRKEYQDFLAHWKDADPDLSILQAAKQEYEKLK